MHAPRRPRPSFTPPRLAQGFSLLEAALLVLLIGGALVTGALLLRAPAPVRQAQMQEQALQMADEALVAYAAAYARLPCPVSAPDGTSCVAQGTKGWLPVRALEDGLQRPLAVDNRRLPPLRYIAYGGTGGTDLTNASDRFNPHQWDGTAYDFKAVNGLDLCAGLAAAATESATANSARANVLDADGHRVNIAYALAAAGPTAGNASGRFDGLNQGSGAQMESPALVASADYDDRVRARGFDSLARTLGCGYANATSPDDVMSASLDLVALGVDMSNEVTEQHDGNEEDTKLAVVFASLSEVFAGVTVALSGANIANSSSTLATAAAQLSAAIAACALPPWAQCALIPVYTAAVTAGGIAVGLSIAATVAAAAALAPTSAALALTIQASELAKQPLGSSSSVNIAEAMQNVCLTAEGGYTTKGLDANGQLIVLDPPVWHDGLKQDVEKAERDLAEATSQRDGARHQLDTLEAMPPSLLIDYPLPPDPDASDDDDDDANYNAWVATQRAMEEQLRVKLEAVRGAESARFEYEKSLKAEEDAQRTLDTLVENSTQIATQVADCVAHPPGDPAAELRCENARAAQKAIDLCQFDPSDTTSRDQRQCVPWKREDLATASAARQSAYDTWQSRQGEALAKPQPPLNNYIDNSSGCWVFAQCNVLLVPNQDDDDKRETYAKTYYKYLGMVEAVKLAQSNLDKRRVDYQQMQAQCDDLRKLSIGGDAQGEIKGLVVGAENILRDADARGTVGPVQAAPDAGTP